VPRGGPDPVWLFRIFRNTLLDWAKNVRRTERSILDVDEPAGGETSPSGTRCARRSCGARALPPILREAFLLRHELGHSYGDRRDRGNLGERGQDAGRARPRALREALEPDFAM
jgi:DNA-directed RNA polymerase specialized sigma24 family protein